MTKQRIVLAAAGLLVLATPLFADVHHGWARFVEKHDANGDGAVTKEEMGMPAERFGHLDQDHDGVVTEADLTALHAAHVVAHLARGADDDGDGSVTAAEWDAWFAGRDGNGDGRLDAEDHAEKGHGAEGRHGSHHGHGRLDADGDGTVDRADIAALVARFDADGDGTLSGTERPQVDRERHGRHGRGSHRGHGFHGELDADKDGAVSRAEWDAAVGRWHNADPETAGKRFEAMDTDGNGALSQEELQAGHRRHRHGGRDGH